LRKNAGSGLNQSGSTTLIKKYKNSQLGLKRKDDVFFLLRKKICSQHLKFCSSIFFCEQVQPSEGSLYASPVTTPWSILCATLDGQLVSVDSETGAILWNCAFGHPLFTTPVHQPLLDLALVGCVNRTFYAVSARQGTIVWQYAADAPIFSSPVLYGNEGVLFGCHDRHLYLLNVAKASLMWKQELAAEICASPDFEAAEGRIVAASTKGDVYVLNKSGEILSSFQLDGHIYSSPIFLPGRIIIGSRDNFLYCYDEEIRLD
jgi:outer membrane protein assembly factor BamB